YGGVAVQKQQGGQFERFLVDQIHPGQGACFETEGRPVLKTVSAASWGHFGQQPSELIALVQFAFVVRRLGGAIILLVVVFVLDEIKGRVRTQSFTIESQSDVDQVDGGVLG